MYAFLGILVLFIIIIFVVSFFVLKVMFYSEIFLMRFLNRIYVFLLEFFVYNFKKVILGVFVFLIVSFFLFFFVGKNFMFVLDEGDVVLSVEIIFFIFLD